jgi:hypothetical protein
LLFTGQKERQMADEGPIPAEPVKGSTDEGSKLAVELAATRAELESIKKAQAGSDSKVAKLLAELEQKEKGKQTDAERLAAIERKAEESDRKLQRQEWLNAGYKLATDRGLKPTIVDKFSGTTEELAAFLDELKADFDAARVAEVNRMMTENGHKPGGGGNPPSVDPKKMTPEARKAYFEAEAEKRMSGAT